MIPMLSRWFPIDTIPLWLGINDSHELRLVVITSALAAAATYAAFHVIGRLHAHASRAETLLRDAIDSMAPGLVIYDADDRLITCNESYRQLFPEYIQHALPGMRFEALLRDSLARGEFPDAVGREEAWFAERMRQHRDATGVVEHRLPDGRWVLMTDRRMRNGGTAGLRVDITALKQAEAALQESEYRVRDFASTSSDWFWEQDAALRFLWISSETPMYWKSDKSYSGKRRDELVPHDSNDAAWRQHMATLEARQPFRDFRYSRIGADGAVHHISISGNPVFDPDGVFLGYRGTGRDITAEVEAAAELRAAKERAEQAEALLRDAVDSISEGFVIFDQADRLVMCNDGYRSIYNHSDYVVPGTSFSDLVRSGLVRQEFTDAIGDEQEWYRRRLRQHQDCVDGSEHKLSDGRWVLATDRRMRNGGIAGLRIDITALKQAEARLRDSEARLDRAQRIAGVGSWELDLTTGRYLWSKELYRIRGLSPDTFQPNIDNVAPYVHPDDYPVVRRWIADLSEGVERDTIETRIIRPDGSIRTLHVEGRAQSDTDGIIRRLSGTMQDITDKRLIEQQLAQAQKMEAIGNLTGGMAHDFNNVLGVVIGNLDLLKRMLKDDRLAEELRTEALEGAQRGAELTRRLLAFARRQPLRPQQVDANALVENIARLLSRTLGENIELRLRLGSQLPAIQVDPAQLEAALTNLATNARDAMPHGGRLDIVTRTTRIDAACATQHPEVRPGEYVLIEVSDTGTGIPTDVLGRIFEPFFTTKEMGRGSGLGLAMVFGFMKQSGGHVTVYTEPGRGSTFRLYLPPDRSTATKRHEPAEDAPMVGGYETVLVVEDNPALRRAAVQQLTVLGYRVYEADGARAALDLLETNEPVDLLFSDVVMPGGMDGIDLAEHACELRPALKVLLTSGFPDVRGAEQRINARKFHLLGKPYRQDELARMLRERLDEPATVLSDV
jgi:PAS domain S-box-containing protein